MGEKYYRVTFEDRGYFSAVHDLLNYLYDENDDFSAEAYEDINVALGNLEVDLYCPDIRNEKAIFAYTEEGYNYFKSLIDDLSEVLTDYDFDALKINIVNVVHEIVYQDAMQIAFV